MRDEEFNRQFAQQERVTLRGAIVLAVVLAVALGMLLLVDGI
jgi:hypothetical protein